MEIQPILENIAKERNPSTIRSYKARKHGIYRFRQYVGSFSIKFL